MTDYKALYEQQLAENKKLEEENSNLKAEIESRDEMDEKATEWIEEVFDSDTWDPVEVGKWVKELKQELEEEIQELKSNLDYDPEEAEIVSKDFIKRLEQKSTDLLSFIGGNFDYEDKVKEYVKDFYSEEFIKGNEEQWSQVCIDWDDSDFQ